MVALATKLFDLIPAPVAAALMLGGFIFYALGCVRLGYGAAVKPLVLDLIERAEKWLNTHTYTTRILKWETSVWGEIPADFGRK